jgi:hypothetical protein
MRQLGRPVGNNTGTRYWLRTEFTNTNEATGRTKQLRWPRPYCVTARVLFIATVVPQNDAGRFKVGYLNILNSLQIN